jgi:carboxyl-terminal processing protease
MKQIKLIVFSSAVLLIGLVSLGAKDRYEDLQIFSKVLNLVQQYYVEEVDTKKLIHGAIRGMLRELDPHTNFLPPDMLKDFESETSGSYGGLGVEITMQKGILTVISPIEDGPAYIAGIKAGDKVLFIDGESTKGLSLSEVAQKMRGPNGKKVKFSVIREGLEKPLDVVIVRGPVKIKSVKSVDLGDGYIYMKVTSFIENTTKEFNAAYASLQKPGKVPAGMILDLRRNPGGLLDQAVSISDMFLEKGVIVTTKDRTQKEKEVQVAKPEGTLPQFPVVVLVDEFSASASEIVAGALKDHKRAVIMGQRTFGKGSVQSIVKLGDGSGLKLTIARYYTPSGKSIQAYGIEPDILVENLDPSVLDKARVASNVRREKDMQGHLMGDDEQADDKKSEIKTIDVSRQWWSTETNKADPSAKGTLLRDDYQVLQGFNYLKTLVFLQR